MYVKDNQPQLCEDIVTLFAEPQVVAETLTTAQSIDAGHGRIELRRLTASSALVDYTPWPGLQQVFQLKRTITDKKSRRQREQDRLRRHRPTRNKPMPLACSGSRASI